jgi:hypothetical protein
MNMLRGIVRPVVRREGRIGRVWMRPSRVGRSFFVGFPAGGISGLLVAPHSGARTSRRIVNLADDVRERAGDATEDTKAAVQRVIERGRHFVNA